MKCKLINNVVSCDTGYKRDEMKECEVCKAEHLPGETYCKCHGDEKHHFELKRK